MSGPGAPGAGAPDGGAPPILSVVGWKDSGKTGLVVELCGELVDRGHRVMTLKHGHGFDLDAPGTDSWRHRHEGGAERVVLAGPDEMAVLGRWGPGGERGPGSLAARFCGDADLVLAEGWKEAPLPKVEVHRARGDGLLYDPGAPTAGFWVAVVTDRDDLTLPIPVLSLGDDGVAARLAEMVEATLLAGDGAPEGAQ